MDQAPVDIPPPVTEAALDGRVDWPARRLQRVRRARGLSGFGGLVLACTFFLPAVPVCNQPLVPAKEWLEVTTTESFLAAISLGFLLYGAAYLFGLLVFLGAIRSRSYRLRLERSTGMSASLLVGYVGVVLVVVMAVAVIQDGLPRRPGEILFLLFVLGAVIYWMRSLRMGPAGLLGARWLGALCCVVWFGGFALSGDALYGLWLSLSGSLCILTGASIEAAARNPEGGWDTLGRLLRCRLELHDLDGDRCANCGYLLIGLTSQRCPECGEPFKLAAAPATPENRETVSPATLRPPC